MNFDDFTNLMNSNPSPTILLEGSRTVADADKPKLIAIGTKLASAFPNAVFRSGNADGTDSLFAEAVLLVNPAQLELVLPNSKKLKSTHGEKRISLEQLDQAESNHIYQLTKQTTPINKPLIEFYETGKEGSPRYKAQYLLRDALKVTGSEKLNFKPATIGLFYLNSAKATGGGTGHTIRVCKLENVPVVMQPDWLNW